MTGLLRLFRRVKFSVVDVCRNKNSFSGATAWYPTLLKIMARTYFVRSICVFMPVLGWCCCYFNWTLALHVDHALVSKGICSYFQAWEHKYRQWCFDVQGILSICIFREMFHVFGRIGNSVDNTCWVNCLLPNVCRSVDISFMPLVRFLVFMAHQYTR